MNPNHEEQILGEVREAAERIRLSAAARDRIEHRLKGGALGATTLRATGGNWSRRAVWIAAASAALLAAVWLVPAVDRETTVSAAEILGRSQQALASPASGIEVLTYDLTLGGVLQDLLPAGQAGSFTVEETVDYDHPGRYRLVKLAAGGQIMAGLADDPLTRTRVRYLRLEDGGYMLRFNDPRIAALSVIEVKRSALRMLIGMMQATDSKTLREILRGGEAAYAVDVAGTGGDAGLATLRRASLVVDRTHARLLDFDAEGTIGERTFAITFNLRSRETPAAESLAAGAFTIDPAPGDEVIAPQAGSTGSLWDVIRQCVEK